MATEGIDLSHIDVVDRRSRTSFALESTDEFRIFGEWACHHLDRNPSVKLGIESAKNLSHPSLACEGIDSIAVDGLPEEG